MSFKSIVREMKDGIGNISRRAREGKSWRGRSRSHIVPDQATSPLEQGEECRWANIPHELLLDIIRRVEDSEPSWPARAAVVSCASVCRLWRKITKEVVQTPEQCGRLTFPLSLKQPGPRDSPIQCFIKRDRANSTYYLYFGMVPSEVENDKLLLTGHKVRRATTTDFMVSLSADDFSRASTMHFGKLRSNFLGTKFTIFDSQPPLEASGQLNSRSTRRFHSKQVSPRVPVCNYAIGTISYELNVLRTRGPRRMHCSMHTIPISSIQEGGTAPTPTSYQGPSDKQHCSLLGLKGTEPVADPSSSSVLVPQSQELVHPCSEEPLVLKNKAPRWHEQLQCWCLNFRGRVTVASVKNFQLVAAVEPCHNVSAEEQERVILQFGKIGKDIFTMDYRYPLSAFQAFAICLSSFDTKPACE